MIAAITAGGRVGGALAAAIGTDVKALAPLGEAKMIDGAIDAARQAGASRVVVIGGAHVRAHCSGRVDDVVAEAADGRENIRRAISAGHSEALLLLTSDMPFITGAATRAFLADIGDADIALPLATEGDYLAAYPGAPDHITQLGNARVANGSIVYFGPGIAPRVLDIAQRLFSARKSRWRMAVLLGPTLMARFALGRLEIEHIEQRAAKLFGVTARAARNASPALCFDVDGIDDYRYALEHGARD